VGVEGSKMTPIRIIAEDQRGTMSQTSLTSERVNNEK